MKLETGAARVFSPLSERQAITTLGKRQLAMKITALVDDIHRLLVAPAARDAVRSAIVAKVGFETTIPAYLALHEHLLALAQFQTRIS